jgi:hypothetical protein
MAKIQIIYVSALVMEDDWFCGCYSYLIIPTERPPPVSEVSANFCGWTKAMELLLFLPYYISCSVLTLYKMHGKRPRNSSESNMPKRIWKAYLLFLICKVCFYYNCSLKDFHRNASPF